MEVGRMTLPAQVAGAIEKLERAGYEAAAVGGCVRDHLMGRAPLDYDLATSALPDQVERVFAGERVVPTGAAHGTVTLVTGAMAIEITTFRIDGEYLDHRRPEAVRFTRSLREDLARRDFTVNAMAWSPSKGLIDPMGGRRDIGARLIRAVGDPCARFSEDALRILRALRFASSLNFDVERQTARALLSMKEQLAFVARERIGAEVINLATGRGAWRVIGAFKPVLAAAVPALCEMDEAGWARSLGALRRAPPEGAARLAALCAPLGPGARAALLSLRLDRATRERALKLIGWLGRPERAAARLLGDLGPEDARALIEMAGAGARERAHLERLIETDACVRVAQLKVDGRDMRALGLSGPAVGRALARLLDEVIDGALPNERAVLLSRIRTLL